MSLKFIEPMYARSVEKLPEGREWLYEIKLDGYRCLAGRDSKRVTSGHAEPTYLQPNSLGWLWPLKSLRPNTLIDGEIVAVYNDGRISFNLLQHHRSKTRALQFYAFDVLIYRGRSLLRVPLQSRRQLLAEELPMLSGCQRPLRRRRQI